MLIQTHPLVHRNNKESAVTRLAELLWCNEHNLGFCLFMYLSVSMCVCVYEWEMGLKANNTFGILFMVYFCPF